VKSRPNGALVGLLAFTVLSIPVVAVTAAPAKKAPAKKAPAKAGDAKAGKAAFKSEGCSGCHKTTDYPDGTLGPDLSKEGASKKAADISAYIGHPKAGSQMPPFKGPKKTLDDLTAYVLTQK
jgi:mono/diheme cytochrome c family protein